MSELEERAAAWELAARYELGRRLVEGNGFDRDEARGLAMVADAAGELAEAALYLTCWPPADPTAWGEPGALERLTAAARGGDRPARLQLALRLACLKPHLPAALELLANLATEGDPTGAYWYARLGGHPAWFVVAARAGHVPAMEELARPADDQAPTGEHLRWLIQAAQAGSIPAAYELGRGTYDGTDYPFDLQVAHRWLRRAAAAGHAPAASLLEDGFMPTGEDPWSPATALAQHECAAAAGNMRAMVRLARMHELGEGTPVAPRQALKLYELAAQAGEAAAVARLIAIYRTGPYADPVLALRWVMLAIARERAAHERTTGQPWPDTYAERYADLALRFGSLAESRAALARRFALGLGVPHDPREALRWYGLARALHPPESAAAVKLLLEEAVLTKRHPQLSRQPAEERMREAARLAQLIATRPVMPWLESARRWHGEALALGGQVPWLAEAPPNVFEPLKERAGAFVAGVLACERPAVAAAVLAELGLPVQSYFIRTVLASWSLARRQRVRALLHAGPPPLPPLARRWIAARVTRALADDFASENAPTLS